jgi:hypothetical protein
LKNPDLFQSLLAQLNAPHPALIPINQKFHLRPFQLHLRAHWSAFGLQVHWFDHLRSQLAADFDFLLFHLLPEAQPPPALLTRQLDYEVGEQHHQ